MPQNTERGPRNSGGGSTNSLESDSARMESHRPWSKEQNTGEALLRRQGGEHRVKLEDGAGEWERKPMQGKEVPGGPEGSLSCPHWPLSQLGPPTHTHGPQGGDHLQDGAHLARWSRLSQKDMAKESTASASF